MNRQISKLVQVEQLSVYLEAVTGVLKNVFHSVEDVLSAVFSLAVRCRYNWHALADCISLSLAIVLEQIGSFLAAFFYEAVAAVQRYFLSGFIEVTLFL